MLVAVIMAFLVLSFTGVAVLDVAFNSLTVSNTTSDNIVTQYAMESAINEALWRLNVGEDSLANIDLDGTTCTWDSLREVLTVHVNNGKFESEVMLDLSEDTHFDRGMAARNSIQTNGYSVGLSEKYRTRIFNFLPDVDIEYFENEAVKFHHGDDNSWKDNFLTAEGVHIFTGNNLVLDSINVMNSTLVFTGRNIHFYGTNSLRAAIPEDSSAAMPALILTNPDAHLYLDTGDHIEGAIYCAGKISIGNAELSGPIVSDEIELWHNIDLLETEYPEYYRWTEGFGDQDNYDWPKQIGNWKTTSWTAVG